MKSNSNKNSNLYIFVDELNIETYMHKTWVRSPYKNDEYNQNEQGQNYIIKKFIS